MSRLITCSAERSNASLTGNDIIAHAGGTAWRRRKIRGYKGRFTDGDELSERRKEIILEDMYADMDVIAEYNEIKTMIYKTLEKLDKAQEAAVKRNARREKQLRDLRSYRNCTFNNYSEGGGK